MTDTIRTVVAHLTPSQRTGVELLAKDANHARQLVAAITQNQTATPKTITGKDSAVNGR